MIDEKVRNSFIEKCIEEYYREDKKILIDESVMSITCSIFLIYNLIYFGNKIEIEEETIEKIKNYSKIMSKRACYEIMAHNSKIFLLNVGRDNKKNYFVIKLEGPSKFEKVKRYLTQHDDVIFYLQDKILYESLRREGLEEKLFLMKRGMVELDLYSNKLIKLETIGAIKFEDGKMRIYPREGVEIKVYNSDGVENTEVVKEVNVGDLVFIKKRRTVEITSYKLYDIISRHTRNHALRLFWTDLNNDHKTNRFIEFLPEQYKKIIKDNI